MYLVRALIIFFLLWFSPPAKAIVGNATPAGPTIARHIVIITSSAGAFCSGVLVAPDLVLTAGHCVNAKDNYKLIQFLPGGAPAFFDIVSAIRHPQFDMSAFLNHRATADVALLKLTHPLGAEFAPARLALSTKPATVGEQLMIAGYGVSVRGNGKIGGTLRAATLIVTGQPGTLQIRLVDPATNNASPGLGACTGDSGSPVFDRNNAVVGVVSWSTAPHNENGCGDYPGSPH